MAIKEVTGIRRPYDPNGEHHSGELFTLKENGVLSEKGKPFRFKRVTFRRDDNNLGGGHISEASGEQIETTSTLTFTTQDKIKTSKGLSNITNVEEIGLNGVKNLRFGSTYTKKRITLG